MTKVAEANQEVENAVVKGYKKVEDTVVGGYQTIEDKFVDTFLKKDGETTEEAKERLKKEQQKLSDKKKSTASDSLKLSKEINEKYVK